MRRRLPAPRILALCLGAIILVVIGAVWRWRPSAAGVYEFELPRGKRLIYSVDWQTSDSVALAGGSGRIEGRLALGGTLWLSGLGLRQDGASRIDVRLAELSEHDLMLLGTQVFPDAAAASQALVGPRAVVVFARDGRLDSLAFDSGAPPVFKHLVHGLLLESQVAVPAGAGASWRQILPVPQGKAEFDHHVTSSDEGGLWLTRQRVAYPSLRSLVGTDNPSHKRQVKSQGAVRLSYKGYPVSVDETNELKVMAPQAGAPPQLASESKMKLKLQRIEDFDAADLELEPAPSQVMGPGALAVTAQTDQQLLQEQAGGLTLRAVLSNLLEFGAGGRMPDHNRWLWQVTGLLKLHPELCAQLLPAFRDPAVGPKGRALILDVLAAAGHPLAQEAMRQAIRYGQTTVDPAEQVMLLQRLSLVNAPEAATLDFLVQTHLTAANKGDTDTKLASLYAMGAALGKRAAMVNSAELRAHNERLIDALKTADRNVERVAALRALGNAGLTQNVPWVLPHTQSDDPSTRRAAAAALRKTQTPETTTALVTLLRDADPLVQKESLTSLDEHRLGPADLDTLATQLLSGATNKEADAEWVNFLSSHLHAGPAVPRMLEFLQTRTEGTPLQARVRNLLDELTSTPMP